MAVESPPDFKTKAALPPIRGLRFRHFAGSSDYAGMNDAANAAREANGDHFITPLDGFANYYEHLHNCDKERDLFIVDVDGQVVGYGRDRVAGRGRGPDPRSHLLPRAGVAPTGDRAGNARDARRAVAAASILDVAPERSSRPTRWATPAPSPCSKDRATRPFATST